MWLIAWESDDLTGNSSWFKEYGFGASSALIEILTNYLAAELIEFCVYPLLQSVKYRRTRKASDIHNYLCAPMSASYNYGVRIEKSEIKSKYEAIYY